MRKHNINSIKKNKLSNNFSKLQVLTCYDFQTAQMLNETTIDLVLVGDSLGNVVLGYENTIKVSKYEMGIFGSAVKRGCPDKFVIVDMPFGTYATLESGVENGIDLFQNTGVEALKLEGANDVQLTVIENLTATGVPVMGHIGLTPQSIHQQGGYYTHGKNKYTAEKLINAAKNLERAGAFSIVLECIEERVAERISSEVNIPTIGIGSGRKCDGHVLVINDLLGNGPYPAPSFVSPVANHYMEKKLLINDYLLKEKKKDDELLSNPPPVQPTYLS